jgi:hypothetical protein
MGTDPDRVRRVRPLVASNLAQSAINFVDRTLTAHRVSLQKVRDDEKSAT